LKFHLDEHVDPAVAVALRQRGIDATTAQESGLQGADDGSHLDLAREDDRVVVTNDTDFLRLHRQGVPHAGIAYFSDQSRSIGELIRMLVLMHEIVDPADMRGRVEFI
jgi:predicted nuclease of predicted toxin-antitoxin system